MKIDFCRRLICNYVVPGPSGNHSDKFTQLAVLAVRLDNPINSTYDTAMVENNTSRFVLKIIGSARNTRCGHNICDPEQSFIVFVVHLFAGGK